MSPKVIDYINNDQTVWELEPLQKLAKEGNIGLFIHKGFWQPMDTLREKNLLEDLWNKNKAPWKIWE